MWESLGLFSDMDVVDGLPLSALPIERACSSMRAQTALSVGLSLSMRAHSRAAASCARVGHSMRGKENVSATPSTNQPLLEARRMLLVCSQASACSDSLQTPRKFHRFACRAGHCADRLCRTTGPCRRLARRRRFRRRASDSGFGPCSCLGLRSCIMYWLSHNATINDIGS
jgi:hypothetical protein